jgi:hypothetical protein
MTEVVHAGTSTCPICNRTWLVTPFDDCLLPDCGCYGFDTSPTNHTRPCEACGITHAFARPRMCNPKEASR